MRAALIFNWHSFGAAPGVSFFRVPRKDDEYSINRRNNVVAVITGDIAMKGIQKDKFKTEHFELSHPQEKK